MDTCVVQRGGPRGCRGVSGESGGRVCATPGVSVRAARVNPEWKGRQQHQSSSARECINSMVAAESSCLTLATRWAVAARRLCPWGSPRKNSAHFLLQGSFQPRDRMQVSRSGGSPALQADSLPTEPPGKACWHYRILKNIFSKQFIKQKASREPPN